MKYPRAGRNPRTGEKISIPKKQVATFKPGKAFREAVNRA
jgi:integration host factor subunit beta